jgi:hypothetical protein
VLLPSPNGEGQEGEVETGNKGKLDSVMTLTQCRRESQNVQGSDTTNDDSSSER